MAPVATHENTTAEATKSKVEILKEENKVFNPFYSPSIGDDGDDKYEFAQFKVGFCLSCTRLSSLRTQPSFPDVSWEPLKEVPVSDRGLVADPAKKSLLSAAQKVTHLTPAIGTELLGIDLRQLSDTQKDELCVPPHPDCILLSLM
jgi:sulfonate dioxygenase